MLAPKKYEARWQIQVAQFASNNSNSEEPAALIQRLRTPTVYPVAVLQSCGMHEDREFGDYLDGALKVQAIKNVTTEVEMVFRAASPMQAKQCAEAIVSMIVVQQHGLIEDRLVGRQEQLQLQRYTQALREEQKQLDSIKNADVANVLYLAKLEKLSWLRTLIDALQEEAFLSQMHPAKLVAPIYVSGKPVSPRVGLVLLLGVPLFLMLGVVLHVLVREGWRRVA